MRKHLLTPLVWFLTLAASAQTDVTQFFLSNYGFDSGYHYTDGSTTAVAKEIRDVEGWTPALSADYTITGIYEFGFAGTFNNTTVPVRGYDGEAGGALALSTGWGQTFCYYQDITLPAGSYTIYVPTYNGKSATGGQSLLSWTPTGGTAVSSTVGSFKAYDWTLDQISFTLTKATQGRLQIGYKAIVGMSSESSAGLLIDYVQIMAQNMAIDKTALQSNLTEANKLLGNGGGNGAEALKAIVEEAQAVMENTEATMPQVLEVNAKLLAQLSEYKALNASESNPLNRTSLITNPSFESDASNGWTVSSMQRQNNSYFTRKAGSYYLESWVNAGQQLGNHRVSQVLKGLPKGKYRLTANALHIQQTGSNSTVNKGAAQTGAYLFAGVTEVPVTTMGSYTLNFAVVDDAADVEIGVKAENATGNWLCVDNFILQFTGVLTPAAYAAELEKLVAYAQSLIDKGIQQTVAVQLTTAIGTANTALQGTGTDDDNNTIYDEAALANARQALLSNIANAEASANRYDALKDRLTYASKVLGWWEGESSKASSWQALQTAITTAQEQTQDPTLTDAQLTAAVNALNTSIQAVDKNIYCSWNACGRDADLRNNANQWSYERSMQSKHWILFWESGYGMEAPAAVPGILEEADKIFECYANELGYITINQGKSKTDTYKMIIRLRFTTEWEASGSGIDDQIGLLTLSNGAHTSRSGQTVAHEIGHCFQYQTHCDNGDQNGWMYNWGHSTLNVFWEMCAQWQAYKYYPQMQFASNNEWLNNTLNGLHRHPLCVDLRYNNFFIQDFFCHKHGITFLGRMWNESIRPEDPLQAYMRLTMPATKTASQKLSMLNDEMWEYGARMTTFDMDPIRQYGASTINKRNQTALTQDKESFWWPEQANCIENFGNNAIRLNVPLTAKTIYVEFEGQPGADGYKTYNKVRAGWRIGFVAMKRDGTRVYGDIATATYAQPNQIVAFDCPQGCSQLWLVVSGAPTSYWTRDWLSWSEESQVEQWPYRVKFHQTNVLGKTNNYTYPAAIGGISTSLSEPTDNNVYTISGKVVRSGSTSLEGLPRGIYIVNGRKVMK